MIILYLLNCIVIRQRKRTIRVYYESAASEFLLGQRLHPTHVTGRVKPIVVPGMLEMSL
jgi:hypothetical protein